MGSLKLAIVGISTPWKFAYAANKGWLVGWLGFPRKLVIEHLSAQHCGLPSPLNHDQTLNNEEKKNNDVTHPEMPSLL